MAINETSKSTVILNSQQAEAELAKLKTRAVALNKEINAMRKNNDKAGFDKLSKELRAVKAEMKSVSQQTKDVGLVMKNLKTAPLKDLQMASRKLTKELNGMTRGTKEFTAKSAQLKKVSAELKKVRFAARDTRSAIGRMTDGFNKFFPIVTAGAASLAGLILGFRKIADVITEFEKKMTNVYTLLSDDQLAASGQKLNDTAIEFIKRGHDIDTVTKSMFDSISAGVDAADTFEFMNDAERLAVGGVTELSIATDGLTSVLNAYNLEVQNGSNVADAFFSAQKAGKTTVGELAANIGQIAPIAASLDVSYQELLSSQAALTKKGISTAEATTYLKGAMTALIKPTDEASKLFEQEFGHGLGATAVKTQGFSTILGELSTLMQKYPDEMAEAIPNVRGLTAITALAGDGFQEYTEILQQVQTDTGTASSLAKAYEMQQATTDAAIRRAKGDLTAMTLELKDVLAPALRSVMGVVSSFSHLLLKFTTFLKDNATTVKAVAKIIGYATGAIILYHAAVKAASLGTSLFTGISKVFSVAMQLLTGKIKIATVATRIWNLVMKLNPIGLIITLVVGLGLALYKFRAEIKAGIDKMRDFVDQHKFLKNYLKLMIAPILGAIAVYKKLREVVTGVTEAQREQMKIIEKSKKAYENSISSFDKQTDAYLDKMRAQGKTEEQIINASIHRAKLKLAKSKYNLGVEHEETKKANEALKELQADLVNYQLKKAQEGEEEKARINKEAEEERQRIAAANRKKQREAAAAAHEATIADLKKLNEQLASIRQQQALDKMEAHDREIEQVRIKYEAMKELAHGDIEALKEIEILKKQELDALQAQWDAEQKEKDDAYNAEKDALKAQIAELGMSEDALELQNAQRKWDALIEQAKKYGLDITALKQMQSDELLAIQKEHEAKQLKSQQENIQAKIEADLKEFQARATIAKDLFSITANLLELVGAEESRMIGFQKAAALVQIGIDTAAGISKYIAKGTTGEPISTAANIAAGVALVTSNMVRAKKIMDGDVPQYAEGKYNVTGSSTGKLYTDVPYIGTPSTGVYTRPALFAEEGPEFIVNSTDLNDPMIANYVGMIQALKLNQSTTTIPQYAEGKSTDVSNSYSEMMGVMNKLSGTMDSILARLNNPIPSTAVIDRDSIINLTEAQSDYEDAFAARSVS